MEQVIDELSTLYTVLWLCLGVQRCTSLWRKPWPLRALTCVTGCWKARNSHCADVYLTQNLPGYLASVKGYTFCSLSSLHIVAHGTIHSWKIQTLQILYHVYVCAYQQCKTIILIKELSIFRTQVVCNLQIIVYHERWRAALTASEPEVL